MIVTIQMSTGIGRKYPIEVTPNTTIRQLKLRLCEKSGDSTSEESLENMCLICGEDILYDNNQTLNDFGVKDNASLMLHELNIKGRNFGTLGIGFVDISNTKALKRCQWGKQAPRWRIAEKGLCLEGICDNSHCKANKRQVVIPVGYRKINILEQTELIVCPMCKEYVEPFLCGFNNCWWRFEGKKVDKNNRKVGPQDCSCDWQEADDAYHYFDDTQDDRVIWKQLVIEAVQKRPT